MTAAGSSVKFSSSVAVTLMDFGRQLCGVNVTEPGDTVKPAFDGRSTVTVTSDVGCESSLIV